MRVFAVLVVVLLAQIVLSQNIPMNSLDHYYDKYEPLFDSENLELHHQKIQGQYVNNLNPVLRTMRKDPNTNKITKQGIDYLVTHLYQIRNKDLEEKININGGGYVLHDLFWKCIIPKNEYVPLEGELLDDIISQYDSYEEFVKEFTNIAMQYNVPGWLWFVYNPVLERFEIYFTNNNEHIQNHENNVKPLFLLDLWEHAYVFQYSADRYQYIQNFFEQINWPYINETYENYKNMQSNSEL